MSILLLSFVLVCTDTVLNLLAHRVHSSYSPSSFAFALTKHLCMCVCAFCSHYAHRSSIILCFSIAIRNTSLWDLTCCPEETSIRGSGMSSYIRHTLDTWIYLSFVSFSFQYSVGGEKTFCTGTWHRDAIRHRVFDVRTADLLYIHTHTHVLCCRVNTTMVTVLMCVSLTLNGAITDAMDQCVRWSASFMRRA